MSNLQRRALARLPLTAADVEAAYQMFKLPTVRDVCESHERLRAECQGLQTLHDEAIAEVRAVLSQLDGLAQQWGDEGVFRRCRDRLRAVVGEGKAGE